MATKLSYDQLAIELGRAALSRDELRFELYEVKQERDTYRDLCAELLEAINKKSTAENLNQHIAAMAALEFVIAKAESILGEKNGTSN